MRPSIYDDTDPQFWIDRAAEAIVKNGSGELFDSELSSLANTAWREAVEHRVAELLADTDAGVQVIMF